MCGFCGTIGPGGTAGVDHIDAMTAALSHRGPDDTGTWQARFGDGGQDFEVALGHRRLSILDLSAHGHQPMPTPDGDVVIAYNGEVYNSRELRSDLERGGCAFRSECDTEVVLEAYRAWGLDALQRFNGMFALAIWDGSRRRLVLARDRLGIKPVYYRHAGGVLSFGSELGALRRHGGFRAEIDLVALETYIRFGWLTGEQAIYRDTFRLLPGHYLVWEASGIRRGQYWSLTDHAASDDAGDFDAITSRLDRLLGDAVEARMVSDVPLGALLSGGVDSSAVVALMQERARGRVRTFSIGFEQAGFDEAPHARAVARHLGTDHTELYVGRDQAREVLRELPTLYDEPFSDPSAVPTVLLSRMTREQVTVALSGDGGDELWGGYVRYGKLRRLLPLLGLPRSLRRALLGVSRGLGRKALYNGFRKLASAEDESDLAESFLRGFDEPTLQAACRRDGPRSPSLFRDVFRRAPTDSAIRRAMYAEACTYLNDDVLVKVDRASMSMGLEVRVPLLDHRVVEFAFSLPDAALSRGGQSKAPLRQLLYRRVPRDLIERPKQGFGFPIRALLEEEVEDWTRRYLAPERIAREGLLDPEVVARMVESTRVGGPQAESEIWRLLCFQRWHARNHLGETDA